jgi:hypothetical protein
MTFTKRQFAADASDTAKIRTTKIDDLIKFSQTILALSLKYG